MRAMGRLSIVATPIGNLEDITLRALRMLKECDVIYAEDTRVISKLLARYEIQKPLQRLDAITEMKKASEVITRLEAGEHIVYVSDAGTPGISDPGARLVASVRELSSESIIETIPGPSALTAAISIAGLNITDFIFLGFLPHKKGRQTLFKEIADEKRTVIFYESPHRFIKSLTALANSLDETRTVTVCRELTKIHESVIKGNAKEVFDYFTQTSEEVRGEFVVIVGSC